MSVYIDLRINDNGNDSDNDDELNISPSRSRQIRKGPKSLKKPTEVYEEFAPEELDEILADSDADDNEEENAFLVPLRLRETREGPAMEIDVSTPPRVKRVS